MTPWNVVAAVALERNTDGQTRYAIETAASLPANLTVLYVGPDRIFARRMFQVGGGSCEALLEKNPAQSIVRYAHAVEADLILLTDDHFGVPRRFWKPTVAQAVMRLSPKPVMAAGHCLHEEITGEPLARAWPYRVILCPLALDSSDRTVMDHAAVVARKWDAELVLLGVVPKIDDGLLAEMRPASLRPLCEQQAASRLQFLASRLSVPNRTVVRTGSAEKAIEEVSRECEADLLIAARAFPHGSGAFRPDLNSLRRKLHCPVLSVVEGSPLPRPSDAPWFEAGALEDAYVLKR
jgi:nucleotide-binding universal stress UspA family protein